jgi:hypothetical protein
MQRPVIALRGWIAASAIVTGLLLAAAPAQAHPSCTAVRAGGHVIGKTKEAVVFDGPGSSGGVYGCHRSAGRRFRLDTATADVQAALLAGRYVAVVERVEEFMEPLFVRILVVDLVNGHTVSNASGDAIPAFVLKRNASVAWVGGTEDNPDDPQHLAYSIHRISHADGGGNVVVDSGGSVDPASLVLSADRRSIHWMNAGEARSAPLR